MGIDRVEPKDFGFEHAMSHEEVIYEGSDHKPSLLLMLCDTYQSQLRDDTYVAINRQTPPKYNYFPYPDVIQGYATSRNGDAFEVAGESARGGLFTNYLIKMLKSQTLLCVSKLLAKVQNGVNKQVHKYGDANLQVPMEVTSAVGPHWLSEPISTKRKKEKGKVESTKAATNV